MPLGSAENGKFLRLTSATIRFSKMTLIRQGYLF
jgi:hypothetical protein